MPGRVTVPVEPGFSQTFRARNGLVGRDLDRRAERVENSARRQAGFRSGQLRSRMRREWVNSGSADRLTMKVGSDVSHALVHHEGSRPHRIAARNTKVLRYVKDGRVHYAKSVQHPGTKANRYLSDALPLAVKP